MGNYDFSGYATRNDLLCGDGRIIKKDAFKHNDGKKVSLVWNHDHDNPESVFGHAILENREDGVYAYGYLNKETKYGAHVEKLLQHGDVEALSIYANKLKHDGPNVVHGEIRELSLVIAGANPGAYIDFVVAHSEDGEENLTELYANYEEPIAIRHAEEEEETEEVESEEEPSTEETTVTEEPTAEETVDEGESDGSDLSHADDKSDEEEELNLKKVFETFNEVQKKAFYYVVGKLVKESENDNEKSEEDNKEDNNMKHNVFDKDTQQEDTLMHSEIINSAIADAKRYGSLRESVLQHAAANNITNIGDLLPKEKDLNLPPEWIREDDSWVAKVMGSVHHTPFSRVRALFATMDETEARARGYIKGKMKADISLAILKRTTSPTTVYIKMKMDRDDVVDISDFDVLAWQRTEMRKQLDRELARAFLLGDQRTPGTDDKIDELCIRPVLTDDAMYTIKYTVTDGTDHHNDFNSASENDSEAKGVIRAAIKSRKEYKGSGNPTFFTTEDLLTELLLIEDQNGRRIYESINTLATAMRVKEIVTVPEMESHTDIYGIIVNMNDYNTGADKGGAVSMFDDFDIDYNQMKYLMETRCSGALVKPYSAIVLKKAEVAG